MKMKNTRILVLFFCLAGLAVSACSLAEIVGQLMGDEAQMMDEQAIATMIALEAEKAVELTLQAMVTDTPEQPVDPTPDDTGGISGRLGYPSSFIPPLRVVAFNLDTGEYFDVDTEVNQSHYEITGLPPGTYHVVAYVQEMGPDIAGGYSEFVLCGLSVDCQDHQLVDVIILAGQVVEDVDPVDFYMLPGEADWPEEPPR